MLFNSPLFIFIFLPVAFVGYFLLNRQKNLLVPKLWLIVCSLFFYSMWNIAYLPLIVLSMVVNYAISLPMVNGHEKKKVFLLLGLGFNLSLLGYFKYMDFFITNANELLGTQFELFSLALPLAISFYTLQQIAFLIDSYGGLVKERNFADYVLFVIFFPQLIAGPIVHHKEMMPQFSDATNRRVNYNNVALGVFVFSIGLFKKVIIADTFAQWASAGFGNPGELNLLEAWATSLSYTFQLYFDFSGYTDMAIGASLLFNIKLPRNFNSPYRARNVIDFWARWHMTLTRFLTTYIYEPVVRSFGKFSFNHAMFATVVTMFIAGLWHGAAWTFVIFGLLHGFAIVINHYWKKTRIKMHQALAWFLTFNFLNLSFVIFRAQDLPTAISLFKAMFGVNGLVLPERSMSFLASWQNSFMKLGSVYTHIGGNANTTAFVIAGFIFAMLFRNSTELEKSFKTTPYYLMFTFMLLAFSFSMLSRVSEFLYFNF